MTALATKPEQKRLSRSVQTVPNQTNTQINLTCETGIRAQVARQMPEPPHISTKWLDRGAKWRQHHPVGVLLGESHIKLVK